MRQQAAADQRPGARFAGGAETGRFLSSPDPQAFLVLGGLNLRNRKGPHTAVLSP